MTQSLDLQLSSCTTLYYVSIRGDEAAARFLPHQREKTKVRTCILLFVTTNASAVTQGVIVNFTVSVVYCCRVMCDDTSHTTYPQVQALRQASVKAPLVYSEFAMHNALTQSSPAWETPTKQFSSVDISSKIKVLVSMTHRKIIRSVCYKCVTLFQHAHAGGDSYILLYPLASSEKLHPVEYEYRFKF